MSRYRKAARVDGNQGEIVKALQKIPGVSVATGHDDILVGFRGHTYWFEIKVPEKRKRLQPAQTRLKERWTGQYDVVWETEHILNRIFDRGKETGIVRRLNQQRQETDTARTKA